MPSQAMQDVIDTLRGQQKTAASQPSPTLEQLRAAFAPAGRLHPLPDDVVVMLLRLTGHVRVITAGEIQALERAELGEEVEVAEQRCAADTNLALASLVHEVGRGEVAGLPADERGNSLAGPCQTVARVGDGPGDHIHIASNDTQYR